LEDFKRAWRNLEIEEAKRGFTAHLASYVVINTFLIFVNLYTFPSSLWFPWVVAGWGIGLAFHFAFSRERLVISEWEKKVARIELRARTRSSHEAKGKRAKF